MVYSDVAADGAVVYSDVFFAKGPYDARATELPLGERGVYRITVADLRWQDVALRCLTFGVFTATAPIQTMDGAGTFEFFYTGRGEVFLALFATPAHGKRVGLIGVEVTSVTSAAVVALPASLWLLLSGLTAAVFWGWLQRRTAALSRSVAVHVSAMAPRVFAASTT